MKAKKLSEIVQYRPDQLCVHSEPRIVQTEIRKQKKHDILIGIYQMNPTLLTYKVVWTCTSSAKISLWYLDPERHHQTILFIRDFWYMLDPHPQAQNYRNGPIFPKVHVVSSIFLLSLFLNLLFVPKK